MTLLRTSAVVILAFVVAACGGIGGDLASSPPPDAPVTGPPQGDAGDEPSPEPSVVEPRPGMADVSPRPFDSAEPVDDEASVEVGFWSGVEPCYVLDRVEVDETDHEVVITLFEGHDPAAADQACIEIAILKQVTVELERPVGDRTIVDGAASQV